MTGSKKTLDEDNIIQEHVTHIEHDVESGETSAVPITGEQGDLEGEQIETIEIVKSPTNQQSATQHDAVPGPTTTPVATTVATTVKLAAPLATVATTPPTEQTLANIKLNSSNNQIQTTMFPFVTVEVDKAPEELNNIKKNETKIEPEKTPTTPPPPTTTTTSPIQSTSTIPPILTPTPAAPTSSSKDEPKPHLPVVPVDQQLILSGEQKQVNETKNNKTTPDESVSKKHFPMNIEKSNEILKNQPNDAILIPGGNKRKINNQQNSILQDETASKRTNEPSSTVIGDNLDNSFEGGLTDSESTETFTLINNNKNNNNNNDNDNFIQDRKHEIKLYTPNPNLDHKPNLNTPPSAPSNHHEEETTHLVEPPTSSSSSTKDEKKYKDEKGDKRAGVTQHYSSFTESEEEEEMIGGKIDGDKKILQADERDSGGDKRVLQKEIDEIDSHIGTESEKRVLQKEVDEMGSHTTPPAFQHPTKALNPESHLDGLIRPTMVPNQFIVPDDELTTSSSSSLKKTQMLEEKGKGRQLVIPVMMSNQQQQQVVMSPMFTTVNQPQEDILKTQTIIQGQTLQGPPQPGNRIVLKFAMLK